jgi:HD-GYP domain-containing protein (c-di-GMP phosphodiesterase class II)
MIDVSNDKNYIVRQVDELISNDIILHPIYREDGLMLINRYTSLTSFFIKQIRTHYKSNTPIIIASSEEQLQKFLNEKLYADNIFINDLKKVVETIKYTSKICLNIEAYVDSRVVLENYSIEKQVQAVKVEEKEENVSIKVITTLPLWNSFELRLESSSLQSRAKEIRSQLTSVLSNDNSLLNLIDKMREYDDLLIIRGVNIACITILIGLTLELKDSDLIELAISALFCNIGFTNMEKTSFYAFFNGVEDSDLITEHIRNSLVITTGRSRYCRNKNIIYGILDHHEYFCGGGYPTGKKSKEISVLGRIIAIAMAYEKLVGGYLANSGTLSTKATGILWENQDGKLDSDILKIYMYRSNLYKVGESFYNSVGQNGVIIGFTNYIEAPHKPIVSFSNGTIVDYFNKGTKIT